MKFLLAAPVFVFAFLLPLITGLGGKKQAPYKFWLCFYTGIPVLIIVSIILFCLRGHTAKPTGNIPPVENDEIFDHLFLDKRASIRISRRLAA
jgi:hypothetical protein